MASTVGNKTLYQELTSVTPNVWTDLLPLDTSGNLKNLVIPKLIIHNTGTPDITVSVKLITVDIGATPNVEQDGHILSDFKIAGSARRNGTVNNLPGTNPVNFSKPMAPHVEGIGPGGYDANSFGDWNGLTYSGRHEVDFYNSLPMQSTRIIKAQFKCNVASGFIATLFMGEPQQLIRTLKAGTGNSGPRL